MQWESHLVGYSRQRPNVCSRSPAVGERVSAALSGRGVGSLTSWRKILWDKGLVFYPGVLASLLLSPSAWLEKHFHVGAGNAQTGKEVRRRMAFLSVNITPYWITMSVPQVYLHWCKALGADAISSPVLLSCSHPSSALGAPWPTESGNWSVQKRKKRFKHRAKSNMFFFPARISSPIWLAAQLHKQLRQHSGGADRGQGLRGLVRGAPPMKWWKGIPAWAPSGTSLLRGPLDVAALPSHPAGGCSSVLPSSRTQRARSNRHSSILPSLEGAGCSAPGKAGSLVVVCSPVLLATCSRAALEDRLRERLMLIPGDSQE